MSPSPFEILCIVAALWSFGFAAAEQFRRLWVER